MSEQSDRFLGTVNAAPILEDVTLLPCPFCGGSATMYASNGVPHSNEAAGGTRHVECDECYAQGPAEPSPRNGSAWNRRLAHTARPDAGDAVEALAALIPSNIGPLHPQSFPDDIIVPVDMTAGEIRRARAALVAMREGVDRGMVEPTLFPQGAMWRSGHDGTGPDPSRFFCEVIGDAPECRRVRVVADTEVEARSQAAALSRKGGQANG